MTFQDLHYDVRSNRLRLLNPVGSVSAASAHEYPEGWWFESEDVWNQLENNKLQASLCFKTLKLISKQKIRTPSIASKL